MAGKGGILRSARAKAMPLINQARYTKPGDQGRALLRLEAVGAGRSGAKVVGRRSGYFVELFEATWYMAEMWLQEGSRSVIRTRLSVLAAGRLTRRGRLSSRPRPAVSGLRTAARRSWPNLLGSPLRRRLPLPPARPTASWWQFDA